MNHVSHKIGGLCVGLAASSIVNGPFTVEAIPFVGIVTLTSVIGSLLPDIDEPNSFIGQKIRPISLIIKATAGHRGAFHTPFLMLVIDFLLLFLVSYLDLSAASMQTVYWAILGMSVGWLSHLFMDALTSNGICFLWPFSKKKFSLMKLKTNRDDWIARLIFIIITIMVIGTINYGSLIFIIEYTQNFLLAA